MSSRALCDECSIRRKVESARQMMDRKGPFYDQWVQSVLAHARTLMSS